MDASSLRPEQPSRLRLLLDHFSRIEDKRSPEGVGHKLNEILLFVRLRQDRRVRQFRRHL